MKVKIQKGLLVKWAKGQGFGGKSLEDLKTFLDEKGLVPHDSKGTEIDVDGSWSQTKAVKIEYDSAVDQVEMVDTASADGDMGDDMEKMADEDEDGEKSASRRVAKGRSREQLMQDARKGRARAPAVHGSDTFSAATKRYEARIRSGHAMLPNAETAEVIGACWRLSQMGEKRYSQRANDQDIVTKAGATYDNSAGGILIPDGYRDEYMTFKPSYGAANVLCPLTTMELPKETVPRFGDDVTVGYTAENGASPESTPTFNGVELVTHEISAMSFLPLRLLEKASIDIVDVLAESHERATAKFKDEAFFNGDSRQVGLKDKVGSNSTHTVSAADIQVFATGLKACLTWLSKLPSWVDSYDESEIKITCSRAIDELVFQQFENNAGGNTKGDLGEKPPRRFNGKDIVYNNSMPRALTSGQIIAYVGVFPRACKNAELSGSQIFRQSEHVRFANRQMAWQSALEFAVNPHNVDNSVGESGSGNVTESGVIALALS